LACNQTSQATPDIYDTLFPTLIKVCFNFILFVNTLFSFKYLYLSWASIFRMKFDQCQVVQVTDHSTRSWNYYNLSKLARGIAYQRPGRQVNPIVKCRPVCLQEKVNN